MRLAIDSLVVLHSARWAKATVRRQIAAAVFTVGIAVGASTAQTQNTVAPIAAHASSSGNAIANRVVASSGADWKSLTDAERQTLAPLASKWESMSEPHRRKWIKIASTMPSMDATERDKLKQRMAEWAKLSRNERELARLNFAQSKVAGKSDRQASWEAYQALSPEERQRLAEKAPRKPVGSTFVAKPVAGSKLIQVPITRHTPPEERATVFSAAHLQPKTLLPVRVETHGASAPANP